MSAQGAALGQTDHYKEGPGMICAAGEAPAKKREPLAKIVSYDKWEFDSI